ncbi:MAG: zinc ribbon domain-containing protein [Ruminococcaceae bacterium]|nr:zinc ribbon domain-containing protein [Oscillospiraceae bacterium]
MFCKNCGTQVNDNEKFCGFCGAELLKNNEAVSNIDKPKFEYITVNNGEQDNSQNISANVIQKSNGVDKKTLIIIGAVLTFVATIVLAKSMYLHFNSTEYKIEKAASMIIIGNYDEGLDLISNIYEPQAESIRKYVELLKMKDDFISTCRNYLEDSNMATTDSNCYEKYSEFLTLFYEFNDNENIYLLPKKLRNDFDYISDSLNNMHYDLIDYAKIYNVQSVFMNEISANSGSKFTLQEMQDRINETKTAIDSIEEDKKNFLVNLADIKKARALEFDEMAAFTYELDVLLTSANSEVQSCQSYIEDELNLHSDWSMDSKLYRTNPDSTYRSTIGGDFLNIASEEIIGQNASNLEATKNICLLYLYLNNMHTEQ